MGNGRRARPPVDQHGAPGQPGPLPAGHAPRERVRGTVVNCDASGHTYLVATPQGRVAMPRIRMSPGDLSLIPNGTPVVVDYSLGEPYIAGILPAEGRRSTSPAEGVTGVAGHGGDDPVLTANYGVNARAGDEPNDLIPGDMVMRGPGTASVAALHGNVAMLQGGRLAQLRAFGDSDAVEIVSGIYRLVTWMGEARVVNEEGKTSYVWRGGSDQLTQTGPDEERYPIRLDVGHSGDLINLEVCAPQGQTLFRFHVNAEGRLEIFAAGGVDQTQGGAMGPVRVAGSRETDVRGDDSCTVGGVCKSICRSNRYCSVSSNDELVVGQDIVHTSGRDTRLSANEKVLVRAGDDVEVASGGDIRIATTTGSVTIRTGVPDGVKLGRNPRFHGVNFEPLAQAVALFLADYNAFKATVSTHAASVAAHTHAVTSTPGGLIAGPSVGIPGVPGTPSNFDVSQAKSEDVVL